MKKNITTWIIAVVAIAALVIVVLNITGSVTDAPRGCTDTDVTGDYPDGINQNLQGIASYENRQKEYADYCVDGKWVNEYFCDPTGLNLDSERYLCENGCIDGACIE